MNRPVSRVTNNPVDVGMFTQRSTSVQQAVITSTSGASAALAQVVRPISPHIRRAPALSISST
jgi:hypothetical protein